MHISATIKNIEAIYILVCGSYCTLQGFEIFICFSRSNKHNNVIRLESVYSYI